MAQGVVQGRAEEAAQMLLRARGFAVTGAVCDRVTSCCDTSRREAWAEAAVTAASLGEVFER